MGYSSLTITPVITRIKIKLTTIHNVQNKLQAGRNPSSRRWSIIQGGVEPADTFQIGIHYKLYGNGSKENENNLFNTVKYAICLLIFEHLKVIPFLKLHREDGLRCQFTAMHSCKRFW